MGILKKGLVLMVLPLFAFTAVHKFYVSVTNINYSEKDDALQITSRVFIDDLERVLKERYDIEVYLTPDDESPTADEYLEKYLRTKFAVEIDGAAASYEYIGKKYDNDVLVFYLEVPKVELPKIRSIQVQNELLTDLFDEQQNIVHFRVNDKKKSLVLMKENTKGLLIL